MLDSEKANFAAAAGKICPVGTTTNLDRRQKQHINQNWLDNKKIAPANALAPANFAAAAGQMYFAAVGTTTTYRVAKFWRCSGKTGPSARIGIGAPSASDYYIQDARRD